MSDPVLWATSASQVCSRLGVDPQSGLSRSEAAARLRQYGPNQLQEVLPASAWSVLFRQLASPIVYLLTAAAVVAFAFGEWLDGSAIVGVLALNTVIGFVTELRAVRSMAALRSLGSVQARVLRDGRDAVLAATELVPGDIVMLEAGDVITADVRLIEASKMKADESTLTGESLPVGKSAEEVDEQAPLAERSSMLFKGTALTRGAGRGVVVATGMQTELGRIARLVEGAEAEVTPLEERLSGLSRWLIVVTLAIVVLTSVLGVLAGKSVFLMIEIGIALAVAAIPEGLPIVATMALARGMWRMARNDALVNRLSAVETLGATTVIFTDKTGTLTENRMTVRALHWAGGRVELSEDALEQGSQPFRSDSQSVDGTEAGPLRSMLEVLVLCNDASLDVDSGVGDPLEVALLRAGRLAGLERSALEEVYPRLREEAFDAATRMMATFHDCEGGVRVAVKGAAEKVLAASCSTLDQQGEEVPLGDEERQRWLDAEDRLAAEGMRILSVAQRIDGPGSAESHEEANQDPYQGLTFFGLVALHDPPRSEVRPALEACRAAGVRVVMVTGDQAATAASVARSVGLTAQQADDRDGEVRVVLGSELERLSELPEAERRMAMEASIYARVTPEQKLDLISAYQDSGEIVAMTGDGVNDAPALKKADIGIAMGLRGTQVAREASEMVLADDDFGSIVTAIEQGRVIFDNIRKFVFYLLSCNLSEVMVVALATSAGAHLPILPLQILFLNLVTDVFPALALAFGEGDESVLSRPPRPVDEPLMTRRAWWRVGAYAVVLSAAVLLAMVIAEQVLGLSQEESITVSFLTLGFAQLWHVFNTRSREGGVLLNDVTRNPWVWGAIALCGLLLVASVYLPGLSLVLETSPLNREAWLVVVGLSLVPLVLGQSWLTLSRLVGAASGPR